MLAFNESIVNQTYYHSNNNKSHKYGFLNPVTLLMVSSTLNFQGAWQKFQFSTIELPHGNQKRCKRHPSLEASIRWSGGEIERLDIR